MTKTLHNNAKSDFRFSRDEWHHLMVTHASGAVYRDVVVVPLFPVSAPNQLISIVNSEGQEIACFDSIDGLSPECTKLVRDELALREFVPIIERVLRVSGTQEPCEWFVVTNHGETSFVINSEEDVRRVSERSVVITDANGIRFRVDDLKKLDSRSRSFVEWYV
ncbi:MAG: DUF1854 domain-containing protein [Pirellula sp.]